MYTQLKISCFRIFINYLSGNTKILGCVNFCKFYFIQVGGGGRRVSRSENQ